jgi:anti-sigma factor RsiW
MMRTDDEPEQRPDPEADRRLWQGCRDADAPEDEPARFLDLAAFADGLLVDEDRDRVAALLETDSDAAADVRAAQALRDGAPLPGGLERIIARAAAAIPLDGSAASGQVVAFPPRRRRRMYDFAQWGSVAAALALASWLGFSLGTDASQSLAERRQPSDTGFFFPELFDPAPGLLRDLGEGSRT